MCGEIGPDLAGKKNLSKIARKTNRFEWGCSSAGRAVALQAIGREFESPQLHQFNERATPAKGV